MKRVAVTRPKKFLSDTVRILKAKGLDAVPVPMMELIPRNDGALEKFFSRLAAGEVDSVIITSQNGVEFIFDRAHDQAALAARLNAIEVIGIGPKTNRTLGGKGIKADRMPGTFSSEGIVRDFCSRLKNKRVEVLRSDHGNPVLIAGLESGGAIVKEVIIYDIVPLSGEEQAAFVEEALSGGIDAYTFTSIMTAKSLFMMGESMGVLDDLKREIN
ncbi:MAG TPA: uroporphyrinogen-III synthase, partial [Methanocella sp.]|nr:uroporphyrinogen-III synthase [Methanocella sp.]